jgi:virulence factor Mce-like protein
MTAGTRPRPRRFVHRPGQHRPREILKGAITLFTLILLIVVAVNRGLPFWPKSGTTVWAQFDNVSSLRVGNPVRVAGIPVGKVSKIQQPSSGRGGMVQLRLEDGKVSLHDDARAAIWWRTLLGRNLYVDLDPGSPSAPTLNGPIPRAHTSNQVELDQVLSPLDATGRTGLKHIIGATDGGFAGDDATNALGALAKASPPIANGLPAVRGQDPGDLPVLVAQTSKWMHAIDRSGADLAGLIDSGRTTLAVTAARAADIGTILDTTPAALDSTRRTMINLRATLPTLDQVTGRLRPGARHLDEAATTTRQLFDTATPVLRNAQTLLRRLNPALTEVGGRFAPEASATFSGLKPTIDRVHDQVLPFLERDNKAMKMKVYELLGPTLSAGSAFMATTDAQGAFVQFEAGVGEAAAPALPCKTMLTDPTAKQLVVCDELKDYLATLFTRPGHQLVRDPQNDPAVTTGG